jgi:hypothetical protein
LNSAFLGVAVTGLLLMAAGPTLGAQLTKDPAQVVGDPGGRCDPKAVEQIENGFVRVVSLSSYDDAKTEGADPGLVLWNSRLWIYDENAGQYLLAGTVHGSMGGGAGSMGGGATITTRTLDDPWPPGQSCYSMCRAGGGTFWQCTYYCGFLRNP